MSQNTNNSCDLLITGGSVVIPKVGVVETNVMVENGKIKSFSSSSANVSASRRINATGKFVLPGCIDPHVHYGVYTPVDESAKSESRSAAVGGVTTMMRMLRLDESYGDNLEKHLKASKSAHFVDYSIHASILKPDQLREISYLRKVGINSLKIYMNLGSDLNHIYMDLDPGSHDIKEGQVDMTEELMSSVIREGSKVQSIIMVHAEDPEICSARIRAGMQNNLAGLKAWSDCRPSTSEALSIEKISEMGRAFGSNLYFVHIGSTAALDAILAQKEKGMSNYYVETCPHYLTHTTEYDAVTGKVVPPLRSKSDLQSVWSALRNGIIDTIGTDHVANRLEVKMGRGDIWSALAGFPGIGTMLSVLLDRGVNQDRIGIERVVEVTSYNTARIFGMYPRKGTIQPGSDADLTIVDLGIEKKVTPELLQSYSDYTIYDGWKLTGWPVATIVRGKVVMEDGYVDEKALGHGMFVPRP